MLTAMVERFSFMKPSSFGKVSDNVATGPHFFVLTWVNLSEIFVNEMQVGVSAADFTDREISQLRQNY